MIGDKKFEELAHEVQEAGTAAGKGSIDKAVDKSIQRREIGRVR